MIWHIDEVELISLEEIFGNDIVFKDLYYTKVTKRQTFDDKGNE